MFNQLTELLKSLWEYLIPIEVLNPWQRGCILRLGKFHREIGPGFHWLIPFVDRVVSASTVTTTTSLPAQSVLTPSNQVVTAEAIVRWSVHDVRAFLLDIWDGQNLITDSVQGAIADAIRTTPDFGDLEKRILTKSRQAVQRFGITIEAVRLTTLAPVRVVRLITTPTQPPIT